MDQIQYVKVTWVDQATASFDIQVPAHLRGQGIGSAVMYDLIEQADELGMALDIWCEPDPQMCSPEVLSKWYERFGFERTGVTKPGAIRMYRPRIDRE